MKENWLGIIAVVLVVSGALVGYATNWTFKFGTQVAVTQTKTCADGTIVAIGANCPTPAATQGGCGVNPSVVLTANDALQPGTSVTPAANYRLNGAFQGATAPTTKGTVDLIVGASGYLNTTILSRAIDCGSNPIAASLYSVANATETIYRNDGTSILTNNANGGGVNETKTASGGMYNWKVHMVGTDKKSTGTMLFIVDFLNTSAAVQSVTLTPMTGAPAATSVAVPSGYASQTSGGATYAFVIPAIVGANTADYNLQAQAKTGYVISGRVYTATYIMQPFVETDGTFNPGNAAWNSVGVTTSNGGRQTYNFCINANDATTVTCG